MRGLYDQIVEQAREAGTYGCRSCGCTDFYHWWQSWEATGISKPRYETWTVEYGPNAGQKVTSLVWDDFSTSRGGDAADDSADEYWCSDCEDSARTLEELLGLEEPQEPKDTRIRTVF